MTLSFQIVSGALPMTTLVAGFRGSEGLSRPYAFDVYITVPGSEDVEIEDVVGSRATFLISDGLLPQATFGGVFASFELVRAVTGNALYLARIVPRLWQLSLTRHSRMFTKQSIPEIIKAVLEDEGITDFELRLTGSYAVEEHVCQYKESSLDFIQRWMEREGMYYFFEQTEDGEKLVVTDDKSQHQSIKSGAVQYHPTSGQDMTAGRHFDNFTVRHASLPATVKLVDYDYGKPTLDVSGSASVSPNGFGEVREYGRRFFTAGEGARIARIRAEELRAQAAVYHATGGALGIAPGWRYALEDHPKSSLNKEYLATAVEHFGYAGDVAGTWGRLVKHDYEDVYRIDVMAIDGDMQYRHPSRTQWPRIDGFENGVVDGPASSEYAQIDDQGRYSVKFKFDEGTLKDGKASTFVRMMQPHGGSIEGFHFPLRKGTEVIFLFLGGDPDRPVISGVVPNMVTPSPVVASNHTQNIIQTGGSNYLTIEDQSGSQFINLFTPSLQTNFYLGCDRPVGAYGLTAGTGPDATEQGEYKQELGAFNFQLQTKGSGEIFTEKNLNLNAYGKMQQEARAGMYQYAGTEWKRHVKGLVQEHTTGTETIKIDGDVKWSNMTKLSHAVGAEAAAGAETHLLKVTGNQKFHTTSDVKHHFGTTYHLGVGAAPAGGATHAVNVQGTQKNAVSDNQTETIGGTQEVTVTGTTTWNHLSDVTWNAAGKNINVTCARYNVQDQWHWEVGEWKCEHVNFLKIDSVLGAHLEGEFGFHGELHIGAHIGVSAGLTMDIGVFHYEIEGVGFKTKTANFDTFVTDLKATANRLKTAAINMTASPMWASVTALTSMF